MRLRGLAGLAIACGLGLAACGEAAPPAPADDIERMARRCLAQMIADTCRVAQDRSAAPAASAAAPTPVFVAGIGAIDAAAYEALRSSGEAMCTTALQACRREPASAACAVARQLWGESALPRGR